MSNTTIELVNSTDPADFLGKAKKALPNRQLPSVESLERDERYAEVFMDQVREEAVAELLRTLKKENEIKLKDFDSNLTTIKALVSEINAYQSKAHIKLPQYSDIVFEDGSETLAFRFKDNIPVGEAFITSLEFIGSIVGTVADQASRMYEDGQYYPSQLTDVSAYVRPSTLIRPIEFDRYPNLDLDTIVNTNVVGIYEVLWNDKSKTPLTCSEKIDEQYQALNVTVEDWREIDLFISSTETGEMLSQLSEQLGQYRERAFDYLKATQTQLKDIHNQGDLANLARIVLGLQQNNELMQSSMTAVSSLLCSYMQTLSASITKIEQVTKG